jgi:hypothetical protein
MSIVDVAQRIATERPDFDLIAITDVGLPHWRLRVRCEVLARKPISPIDEIVLRAVKAGVTSRIDLMVMLGLDEVVLDAAVVGMLGEEWLKQRPDGALELTDKGRDVDAAAVQERSEERVIPFEYDGLLRRPTLLDLPLEPAQLAAVGAREVPPHPTRWPDIVELRERAGAVERLVRSLGDGRDRDLDLLAVKEVVRRERVYRQATALLLRARRGTDLQVALVLDDRLSVEHEQAFAHAGLLARLGVARGVRSRSRHQKLLTDETRERHDGKLETAVRAEIEACRRAVDETSDEAVGRRAAGELRAARRKLRELDVRTVQCYEHAPLVDVAVQTARERLLIVSPRISAGVLDRVFERSLRKLLERGVEVRLGYGSGRDRGSGVDASAHERLEGLRRDYRNLTVAHLGATKASVLIRDGAFAIVTHFPLLGHRGDPKRTLGDERGWLLGSAELVAAEREQWDERWQRAVRPPKRDKRTKRP